MWMLQYVVSESAHMNELIGRTINAIQIDDDEQHFLAFDTDNGRIIYMAEGDCCSESWFYHVLGADNLLGQTVLETESYYLGEPGDGFSRQEEDKLYSIKLRTARGYADVEFRNSSNGYYGGWLDIYLAEWPSSVRAVQLTGDYTAQLVE